VYIQASDGSWRAFGITSYGNGCGGGGWYSMMHPGMEWFESESGVDITPCHDADGTWNPGPDCQGFPLQPMTASGSWPNSCDGGPVSGWSDSCGAPYLAEDDEDPPTVRIVAPSDGEEFDAGGRTVTVQVRVEADDGDGSGIREVQLVLNGNALMAADPTPPYQFSLDLGSGVYALEAIAVDMGDNSATSSVVTIGVDEAPDVDPGDGSAEGDGGDAGDGDSGGDGDGDGEDDGGPLGSGALPPGFGADTVPTSCACRHGNDPGPGLALLLGLLALRRRRVADTLRRDEVRARVRSRVGAGRLSDGGATVRATQPGGGGCRRGGAVRA
jgi:MYXO-CTERM domain-containing protein